MFTSRVGPLQIRKVEIYTEGRLLETRKNYVSTWTESRAWAQENPTRAPNFDQRLKVDGAQFEYLVCCNAKIYVKTEAKW